MPDVGRSGWWACQHEHAFTYGDEDWHSEHSQGQTDDGLLIPTHCTADWADGPYARRYGMVGHPCMDSSVLMGPFAEAEQAVEAVREYKRRGMWPQVGTDSFDPLPTPPEPPVGASGEPTSDATVRGRA